MQKCRSFSSPVHKCCGTEGKEQEATAVPVVTGHISSHLVTQLVTQLVTRPTRHPLLWCVLSLAGSAAPEGVQPTALGKVETQRQQGTL